MPVIHERITYGDPFMSEQDYHSRAGLERARRLSPERRREIATLASNARWTIKAIKKGNLKEILGVDIDCYVLDDDNKTVVISQTGMRDALNLGGTAGTRIHDFTGGERISPYVGHELSEKLKNPYIFQGLTSVMNMPPTLIHGYNIEDLIDVCHVILQAKYEGKLLERQENIFKQAFRLVKASGKSGIKNVGYALCDYDPIREATIADFRRFVREDAGEWEKFFPNELYENWSRIYQLPIHKCSNGFELRPWKFKYLTEDHIYWPIANTKGAVQQYVTERRKQTQGFGKRLFQYLNDHGKSTTHKHIWHLIGMMEMIKDGDSNEYEKQVEKKFGKPPKE